ncbi:MAG: glutamine--fructose-6-phosphate aminotransferase, partial [Chloroflexi bacterium]|nr:glutamine--fructose-6-phosphate aminotransferase [Chloroflexota bacterium]
MCGIIGYTGSRAAATVLLDGLSRLEYRGYDSSGIALITPQGEIAIHKTPGKLQELLAALEGGLPPGNIGIGHTRWATHGPPTLANAHPHLGCRGRVVIVHNGIVENYLELKESLLAKGHTFSSQTDSEVVSHVIEECMELGMDFLESFQHAARLLKGAHAVVAMYQGEPDKLLALRLGHAGGIAVGYGRGEMLLASDLPALLPYTRRVAYLAHGEIAVLTPEGASYCALDGAPLAKEPVVVPYDPISAARGGYHHFMLKEIMEQPDG